MKTGDIVYKKIHAEAQNEEYPGKVIYTGKDYYTLEFTFRHGKVRESYHYQAVADESNED